MEICSAFSEPFLETLSQLQHRNKWQDSKRNLREGDVILLRDKTLYRNEWSVGIAEKVIPSDDDVVRKVEIHFAGQVVLYYCFKPGCLVLLFLSQIILYYCF